MFDNSFFSPFTDTVGFMRAKAYVRLHISGVFVMHVLIKGDVFEFIGRKNTNNWMVFCESHQDRF